MSQFTVAHSRRSNQENVVSMQISSGAKLSFDEHTAFFNSPELDFEIFTDSKFEPGDMRIIAKSRVHVEGSRMTIYGDNYRIEIWFDDTDKNFHSPSIFNERTPSTIHEISRYATPLCVFIATADDVMPDHNTLQVTVSNTQLYLEPYFGLFGGYKTPQNTISGRYYEDENKYRHMRENWKTIKNAYNSIIHDYNSRNLTRNKHNTNNDKEAENNIKSMFGL